MLVEKSQIYLRGQVWHWVDPIYHFKEDGKHVADGEATMRFSRYVLIIQEHHSFDNPSSVLVIPCSSYRKLATDIPINITGVTNNSTISYAKPSAIFPVHTRTLQQYMCSVPEEVLLKIDAVLLNLIMPTTIQKLTKVHQKYVKKYLNELEHMEYSSKSSSNELNINCLPAAISKISNTMRATLQEQEVYNEARKYFITRKDVPHFADEFYSNVANSIYYSLLEYLDIQKNVGNKFKLPTEESLGEKVEMTRVLQTLYQEGKMRIGVSGDQMMKKFKLEHPNLKGGLDIEWSKYLRTKLATKLNMVDGGIDLIINALSVFCVE